MKEKVIAQLFFFLCISNLSGRSPFRKKDICTPQISAYWRGDNKKYTRRNSNYEEHPIFCTFHENHFNQHLLPLEPIPYRQNSSKFVDGSILNALIEGLIVEIKQKRKGYKNFIVLQHKNFNRRRQCGLIVLKFKDYPFVLKLFIERPKTFVNPYCKGFENRFFFFMSGGANRHVAGLTRIRNLEVVSEYIAASPRWRNRVKMPRKWFWLPVQTQWIEVTGKNIGGKDTINTKFPGIYAIVADEIEDNHEVAISKKDCHAIIMELCNDLHLFIDPHVDNFIFSYDSTIHDFIINIIDTEHFPSIVGIKEKKRFRNHREWYLYLAGKCFKDVYLYTKDERRSAQTRPNKLMLPW